MPSTEVRASGEAALPGKPDGRWGPLHGPASHWSLGPTPERVARWQRSPTALPWPSRPRADLARSFTRHQRPVHEKAVHRPTPMSGNNLRVVSLPHSPTSNTTVSGRRRGSLGSSSIARGAAGRWRPPPATTRKSYATTRQQPGTCHNHDRGSGPLRCPRRTNPIVTTRCVATTALSEELESSPLWACLQLLPTRHLDGGTQAPVPARVSLRPAPVSTSPTADHRYAPLTTDAAHSF